jgi:VanZ family protein
MVEFAVLAGLFWRAFRGSGSFPTAALFALSFSAAALYAASDEWHQSFVKGRGPSARDVLIDSAGALAACLLLRRRLRHEKSY